MQHLQRFHKTRCNRLTKTSIPAWVSYNIRAILPVLRQRVIDILPTDHTEISIVRSSVIRATHGFSQHQVSELRWLTSHH
ncbi:hypothetical protein KLPMCP350B_19860 [Klebsiella pneumoniae]